MPQDVSFLSLAASGLYGVVLIGAALAATTASTKHQPRWHFTSWAILVLLFCLLIASRLTGFEAEVSASIRDALRVSGEYDNRRSVQGPVVAGLLLVLSTAFGAVIYRNAKRIRGRRNFAVIVAQTSGVALVVLVVLRVISLHMIDAALYGPLKLNWFIDLGSAVAILAAALVYTRLVRLRP